MTLHFGQKTSHLVSKRLRAGSRPAAKRRSRAGISLIECIVYIAVFTVVITLSFAALHRTWKTHFSLQRNSHDIAAALHAGEQWRADIRRATGPVQFPTSPSEDWLVQIPGQEGAIVYRLDNGQLRRDRPGRAGSVILDRVQSAQMRLDQRRDVSAVVWELELKSKAAHTRFAPLFSFLAVPPPAKP